MLPSTAVGPQGPRQRNYTLAGQFGEGRSGKGDHATRVAAQQIHRQSHRTTGCRRSSPTSTSVRPRAPGCSPAASALTSAANRPAATLYGLGAGVWTRDGARAYRAGREIQAGRVWTNCYHAYPAHAAFGGYKQSGVGRENHKMMLDHSQQTKNLLVSYSPKALGFF